MRFARTSLVRMGMILIVVVLAVGAWGHFSGAWKSPADGGESESATSPEQSLGNPVVELTPGKLEKARIQCAPVKVHPLQGWRSIPGRFQYDQTRHIELRAPTDGTLQDVLVKPGDSVEPGTLVAEFQSSEIGKARAEVLQLEAQLALADRRWEWERKVALHTQELVEVLTNEPDVTEIAETFKTRTLGQARETLLSAYSRFHLASQMLEGTESLRDAGAMSAKTLQERTANKRTAEAAYQAATEQALFDSKQQSDLAESEYENAQRQLEIGRQKLHALLGFPEKIPAGDSQVPLSQVELRSPIAGTVEEMRFAANERVAERDALFVLADTRKLWVAAEIRDSDWAALKIAVGDSIEVQTPAMPGKSLKAHVVYVGREVSDKTHALPLVAEIDNAAGLFRPGLFARVNVPVGETIEVLAVRPASLMQHEGKKFVFIEQGTGRFSRVDVETGMETPDWIEVRRGLAGGEQVVEQGAFLLKSELLLEREEE